MLRLGVALSCRPYSSKAKDVLIELQGDVLYGIQPVSAAIRAGRRQIHRIFYNKGSARAEELVAGVQHQIECKYLSRYYLDNLTRLASRYKDHHVHQGLVADVSRLHHIPLDYSVPQVTFPDIPEPELPASGRDVWLLLCSIKDPMNLGALLRTAAFLGVRKLIVTGERCDLSAVVSKASSGALEILPVYAVRHGAQFLAEQAQLGRRALALTLPHPALPQLCLVSDVNVDAPTVLVVGSEGEGIPEDILNTVHAGVYIPPTAARIEGRGCENTSYLDSLNVSVATGIILHRLLS